jgi:hypothetical protein
MSDIRGPGPATIERCIAAWQRTRAAIDADGELAQDEQPIEAALDADPNTLTPEELVRRLVRAVVFAESREDESKLLVAALQGRQRRYANRAAWLRDELLEVMVALEWKKHAAPYGTVSVRAGTLSVLILDEQALPDDYCRIERKADRAKILADLKQGVVIEGAQLTNGAPGITLRRPRAIADDSPALAIADQSTDATEE